MDFKNLPNNIYSKFNQLSEQLFSMEKKIKHLENDIEQKMQILRCQIMRVKNLEELSDQYLYQGLSYQDLSPEKCQKLYNKKDYDFLLLDVSGKDFDPPHHLPEAKVIPLEELYARHKEITNRQMPILIISENGTRSILACHILNELGYFNLNNISGGYKFWQMNSKSDSELSSSQAA